MTRRNKMQILMEILTVLHKEKALPLTHIMYKANVNCSVLKEYLTELMKKDLVDVRKIKIGNARIAYFLTPRGINVQQEVTRLLATLDVIT